MKINVSAAAAARVSELIKENEMECALIREFNMGTPCNRKLFLGLSLDMMPEDEDEYVFAKIGDITFAMEEELESRYGSNIVVDLNEEGDVKVYSAE